MKLQSAIEEAQDFTAQEIGFEIVRSKLVVYSEEQWKAFADTNKETIAGLTPEREGVYIPVSRKAYTRTNTPSWCRTPGQTIISALTTPAKPYDASHSRVPS